MKIAFLISLTVARLSPVVVLAAVGLIAGGCAASSSMREPRNGESFSQALHVCRMKQPGRTNRRLQLPPSQPRVAACLRRRGWSPEGVAIAAPTEIR